MTATYRTFDEALAIALADIRSRFSGADISPSSFFYHLANVFTAARTGTTGYAKAQYNNTRPDLATGDGLDNLAAVYGLTRKKATTAMELYSTVPVTTATGSWLGTLTASNASGQAFLVRAAGSWTSAGSVVVRWDSTTTGAANNLNVGAEITISSPPAGMDTTATITSVPSIPAVNDETDEELQSRLSDKMAAVATSGNVGSFWDWVLAEGCDRQLATNDYPPMQEAYIYPQIRGILTMEAVPLKKWTGMTKIPAGASMTDVETYVDSIKIPGVDFDAVAVTSQGVDVRVTITTDTGYGRDWGAAATTSMTATAVSHTTTRVYIDSTVATPTSVGCGEGDRVVVNVGSSYYPNVRTVAAVSDLANPNCYIDVTAPFTDENGNEAIPPAAALTVRPGGPISQVCVDAILELFSRMTPGDTADVVRFPGVDQAHPEDLTSWMFQRALIDASDKITDVTVNSGATSVTAASLSGATLVAYILEPDGDNDWLRVEFSNLNS